MHLLSGIRDRLGLTRAASVDILRSSDRASVLAKRLQQRLMVSPDTRLAVRSISQKMRQDRRKHESVRYETVAEHFAAASSGFSKLALLEALVEFGNAQNVLEIGTAYGISGVAIVLSTPKPNLVTVERGEPQATLGPANIRSFAKRNVEAIKGDKNDIIPWLAAEGRSFDMVFHDGGHDGDGYLRDFDLLSSIVVSGGLYVIDDINWDARPSLRSFTAKHSIRTCNQGWHDVVHRPQVDGALVYNRNVGILIMR